MTDRENFLRFLRVSFTDEEISHLSTEQKFDFNLRYQESLRAGINYGVFIMWYISGALIIADLCIHFIALIHPTNISLSFLVLFSRLIY